MPTDSINFTAVALEYNDIVHGQKLNPTSSGTGTYFGKRITDPIYGPGYGPGYGSTQSGDIWSVIKLDLTNFPWETYTQVVMSFDVLNVFGTTTSEKTLDVVGLYTTNIPLPVDFSDLYLGYQSITLNDDVRPGFSGTLPPPDQSKTLDITDLFDTAAASEANPNDITEMIFYLVPPGSPVDVTGTSGAEISEPSFDVTYSGKFQLLLNVDPIESAITLTSNNHVYLNPILDNIDFDLEVAVENKVSIALDLDPIAFDIVSSSNELSLNLVVDPLDFLPKFGSVNNVAFNLDLASIITSIFISHPIEMSLTLILDPVELRAYSVPPSPMLDSSPFMDSEVPIFCGKSNATS